MARWEGFEPPSAVPVTGALPLSYLRVDGYQTGIRNDGTRNGVRTHDSGSTDRRFTAETILARSFVGGPVGCEHARLTGPLPVFLTGNRKGERRPWNDLSR